jgi:multisubunit Na+/H+ antiporter MnhB subunit
MSMPPEDRTFSVVVRTTARYVVRVMMMFGFYVILHGQITHGDGFAGGVILALAFIMMMLVFGTEAAMHFFSRPLAPRLSSIGGLFLLMIALLGFSGGYFFFNFIGKGQQFQFWSAGIIPFCNIAIGLLVTTSLIGIYAALTEFKPGKDDRR